MEHLLYSKSVLLLVQMYYYDMKAISSSPYAPFNSKEWNSLVSKNAKFENTPIKIQKKFYRTFTLKRLKKLNFCKRKMNCTNKCNLYSDRKILTNNLFIEYYFTRSNFLLD